MGCATLAGGASERVQLGRGARADEDDESTDGRRGGAPALARPLAQLACMAQLEQAHVLAHASARTRPATPDLLLRLLLPSSLARSALEPAQQTARAKRLCTDLKHTTTRASSAPPTQRPPLPRRPPLPPLAPPPPRRPPPPPARSSASANMCANMWLNMNGNGNEIPNSSMSSESSPRRKKGDACAADAPGSSDCEHARVLGSSRCSCSLRRARGGEGDARCPRRTCGGGGRPTRSGSSR